MLITAGTTRTTTESNEYRNLAVLIEGSTRRVLFLHENGLNRVSFKGTDELRVLYIRRPRRSIIPQRIFSLNKFPSRRGPYQRRATKSSVKVILGKRRFSDVKNCLDFVHSELSLPTPKPKALYAEV